MRGVAVAAAVALVRGWVSIYTAVVDRSTAARRKAELDSDLWEYLHDPQSDDARVKQAVEILGRVIRGVPADVLWCAESRRASRREAALGTAGDAASVTEELPPNLSRGGTLLFQAIAATAVVAAVAQIVGQLLRIGEFRAAIPTGDALGIGLFLLAYTVPPLTALAGCAIAAPLIVRAERLAEGRTLALFLAFLALFWSTVFSFFYFLPSTEGEVSFGMSVSPGRSAWAYTWYVLAIVAFLRFSALFPRPLDAADLDGLGGTDSNNRLRRLSITPLFAWGAGGCLILMMAVPGIGRPWADRGGPLDIEWDLGWVLAVSRMVLVYVVLPWTLMILGVLNLRMGLRVARGAQRRRSLWVFVGFVAALWMVLVGYPLWFIEGPAWITLWGFPMVLFAPLVIVVCLAVAVFYKGDIDPGLIIKRSTVWGVLGVTFVILLAAGESLLSDLLVERLGLPDQVGGAILGAGVALIVFPLRGRVSRRLERIGVRNRRVAGGAV